MFGCLVSGRLVQTEAQQVGPTQFLFNLPDADSIHHIVVFLTGAIPFPDGMGAAVHFCWPSPDGPPTWQLLGFISNQKPSAIFKISKVKPGEGTANPFLIAQVMAAANHSMAQIGISIEPIEHLAQQTPATNTSASTVSSFVEFTQKMLQSFFNFASSFGVTQPEMVPNPNEVFVPLSIVQRWFNNFENKLKMDPNFWKG